MSKLLYTLTWADGKPTVDDVRHKYGLDADAIDSDYGIIPIDLAANQYAIMLEESALERITGKRVEPSIRGPYANPPVEPFGLQEDDS